MLLPSGLLVPSPNHQSEASSRFAIKMAKNLAASTNPSAEKASLTLRDLKKRMVQPLAARSQR